ncbi:Autophagy-related protein [Trichinella spiralis]|uniref:Autophagy-related protein n=1 Tax=Trichinella spiralis TaxID=6334 RepID=A0ABR3KW89_TRISP
MPIVTWLPYMRILLNLYGLLFFLPVLLSQLPTFLSSGKKCDRKTYTRKGGGNFRQRRARFGQRSALD